MMLKERRKIHNCFSIEKEIGKKEKEIGNMCHVKKKRVLNRRFNIACSLWREQDLKTDCTLMFHVGMNEYAKLLP